MLLCFDQCIFRKPKECKERHHILMNGTSGDGADSAEDSGSSQPHRSTLPGIPKVIFYLFLVLLCKNTIQSAFDGRCISISILYVYFNG